ncbi:Kremen protein 1 [Holothuria leucospilota]|uniref:Kremen protein 1 n=1 Tax=Holothuria leucospilota TaxID=206669 RepID=A0A9Q1H4H9_HOLLE|nr:Kremen protein 1 [Holothuria leucospilota]
MRHRFKSLPTTEEPLAQRFPTLSGWLPCYIRHYPSESYLGCYNKNITTKHIGKPSKRNQNMTRSLCAEYCLSQNLLVYGLQFGTYCYCSTNDKEFTRFGRVEAVECNTRCAGGPKCGGNDFIAVYNVPLTVNNSTHGNLEEEGPNDKDQQGDMPPFTDILKEYLVWTILVTFVLGFISATIISYGRQTYFLRNRMSKLKQRLRRKRTQKKIKSLINYKDENYLRRSVHFVEDVGTAVTNVNTSIEAETNSAQDKEKPSKPLPPPKGVACNRYYKKYEKDTPRTTRIYLPRC